MRRSDRQITSHAEIESLIRFSSLCHLAMIDNGRPYVVPMNFGYSDGALYFHSAPEGRKIRALRQNPEVCFSILSDHQLVEGVKACSWSTSYRSVIGTGRAEIITKPEEIRTGLKILMAQYSDREYKFSDTDLEGVVVIRVVVDSLMGKSSDARTRGRADAEKSKIKT